MGSIRKKTATKPVPAGAEFFTRGGIRFARWKSSTGCRDKQAAAAVVAQWERRSELVRAGVVTAGEDRIADHQATSLTEHFDAYGEHLQAKGCCKVYRENTRRHLDRLAADCRFSRLGDFDRTAVERWLAESSQ